MKWVGLLSVCRELCRCDFTKVESVVCIIAYCMWLSCVLSPTVNSNLTRDSRAFRLWHGEPRRQCLFISRTDIGYDIHQANQVRACKARHYRWSNAKVGSHHNAQRTGQDDCGPFALLLWIAKYSVRTNGLHVGYATCTGKWFHGYRTCLRL